MLNRTINKEWNTTTNGHSFLHMLVTTIILAFADSNSYYTVSLVTVHVTMSMIWQIQKHRVNMYFITILLTFVKETKLFPMFALMTVALEQGKLKPSIRQHVDRAHRAINDLLCVFPGINSPMFGCNSTSWLQPLNELVILAKDHFSNEIDNLFQIEKKTNAEWIREHGVSPFPVGISERPAVSAATMKSTIDANNAMYRNMIVTLAFGISIVALRAPMLIPIAIFMFIYSKAEKHVHRIRTANKGAPLKEGVYMVTTDLLGFNISHGIGVVSSGVLHIPYHVCGSRPIHIGKTVYYPYYVNTLNDLVTYNGPPCITTPELTDTLYVNCENLNARVTYMVDADVDRTTSMITWHGVTRPGESGSPIYVLRDDKYVLAGLAGRYYKDSDGQTTEYSDTPSLNFGNNNKHQKHVFHPGYGKTSRIIKDIITKHLVDNPHGRILLTGPTRVVCRELYKALSPVFRVSLVIKDHPALKDRLCPVQIMAHQTAITLIGNKDSLVRGITCLVLDEAHFDDSATIQLRQYGKYLANEDLEFHELSATLDGEIANGSNYPIQDVQVSRIVATQTIKKLLDEGKRVMVFVPSIKNRELYNSLREYNPIELSRETFNTSHPMLSDLERRLIITTDIAECGINVPDLDVVFDYGKKFGYFYQNKVIYGRTVSINTASYVQRRGRVGRTKSGMYVYCGTPEDYPTETAATVDAQILMTGRSWSQGMTNPLNIYLSENQISIINKQGWLPTQGHLLLRVNGEPKSHGDKLHQYEEMRNTSDFVVYPGCGNSECKACQGKWQWFDERIHDIITLGNANHKIIQL